MTAPDPDEPPLPPDEPPLPADALWGLVYAHDRANANTAALEEVAAAVEAVVNLLIDRGLLDPAEVEEARQRAAADVRRRFKDAGMAVLRHDHEISKYAFTGGPEIDCASRVHLCRAACCRLRVVLSTEDVREGVLRWDTAQPYALAKRADGSCVHMDRDTCGCTVYARRPMACRGYDCRRDRRIWIDFDGRIPHPLLHDPGWPDVIEDPPPPS